MHNRKRIAIVGGGPAGSLAASILSSAGKHVLLFDEKLAWEKPCGGGITHKAISHWPFLRDAAIERNWISKCELISPAGRRVVFHLEHAVAIFSRKVLNGLLLERARSSGAEIIAHRVTSVERVENTWRIHSAYGTAAADFLVIADGARSSLRKHLSTAVDPQDLMMTAGYYIRGQSGTMRIQFLRGLYGYVWIFPRADHFSAGICGKLYGTTTAELRRLLEISLDKMDIDYSGAQFYAHILPSPRASTLRDLTVAGDGWAMVGDAAGLVDPITGEGLYYAMRSGELLAEALLRGEPYRYQAMVGDELLPEVEMAARVADRFYTGRWMGESVIERMVQFTASSSRFRDLMSDMFAGTQGYHDLRSRLYHSLPVMLAESLVSALRLNPNEVSETPDSSEKEVLLS